MTQNGGQTDQKTDQKRAGGRYYTRGNPFRLNAFRAWARAAELERRTVLEPFAGAEDIPQLLEAAGYRNLRWAMFDIAPSAERVQQRDTLADFPDGFRVCVTNPPWLARNSAARRGLPFPETTPHNDLYKIALKKCLRRCRWAAAIVPEAFIRTGLFLDRLADFISLIPRAGAMFDDTEHPVGLALFAPDVSPDARVWRNDRLLGTLRQLRKRLPPPSRNREIVFNDPNGNLGLVAIDNTVSASIRFCKPEELEKYRIGAQSRFITIIRVPWEPDIDALNARLSAVREDTHDVFLTAFKGLRRDELYRRRLHWALARAVIDAGSPQMRFRMQPTDDLQLSGDAP